MKVNRRVLSRVLFLVTVAILAGCLGWAFSPREFTGRLSYHPDLIGIPEDPPPRVLLVTANGTYELEFLGRTRGPSGRMLHRDLEDMNGKKVVIRGKLHIRKKSLFIHGGSYRKRWVLRVHELRLGTP